MGENISRLGMKFSIGILFAIVIIAGSISWNITNDADERAWLAGFFGDIGVTALGILIAVLLVDEMRKRREAQAWKTIDMVRDRRMAAAGRNVVRAFGSAMQLREEGGDPDADSQTSERLSKLCTVLIDHSQQNLRPNISALLQLDPESTKNLLERLELASKELVSLFTLFGNRLSPEQHIQILTVEGEIIKFNAMLPMYQRLAVGGGPSRGTLTLHDSSAQELLQAAEALLANLVRPQ